MVSPIQPKGFTPFKFQDLTPKELLAKGEHLTNPVNKPTHDEVELGITYLAKAGELGEPRGYVKAAITLINSRLDVDRAITLLETVRGGESKDKVQDLKMGFEGYVTTPRGLAGYILGKLYFEGLKDSQGQTIIPQNQEEGFKLLFNNGVDKETILLCLKSGFRVDTAIKMLERLHLKCDDWALNTLVEIYTEGKYGVSVDKERALNYLNKAVNLPHYGNAPEKKHDELAFELKKFDQIQNKYGYVAVLTQYLKGNMTLEKACDRLYRDDAVNDPNLKGYFFRDAGRLKFKAGNYSGGYRDGAIDLWSTGWENYQNADCAYFLGVCYYAGVGVKADREKALEYWKKAAEGGNEQAQFEINKRSNPDLVRPALREKDQTIEELNDIKESHFADKETEVRIVADKPWHQRTVYWIKQSTSRIITIVSAVSLTALAIGGLIALTIAFPFVMVPIWITVGVVAGVAIGMACLFGAYGH